MASHFDRADNYKAVRGDNTLASQFYQKRRKDELQKLLVISALLGLVLSIMPKNRAKTPKVKNVLPKMLAFDVNAMQFVNPADIKPVYANNASVMTGPHDVRIVFTEIVLNGPAGLLKPELELRANIAMSLTHFKALVLAMKETLERYEKQFGTIQWPCLLRTSKL